MKEEKGKKKPSKRKVISFGVSALVLAGIFSPIGIFGWAFLFAAASGISKLVDTMGEGLDLTTHNKQDEAKKPKPVEELPMSGDTNADDVIKQGQELLKQIRAANDAIPDAALTSQMSQLEYICAQIFKTIAEKPAKAPQIRKFMNYYLPTTLKMLGSYRVMQDRGVSVGDLIEARTTLMRGMDMVITACQKQLDNLFKSDMLDVSTDIDVLEQMLKRDGFVDGGLGNVPNSTGARTAAAAQMNNGAPTMKMPNSAPVEEDFKSFYHQSK